MPEEEDGGPPCPGGDGGRRLELADIQREANQEDDRLLLRMSRHASLQRGREGVRSLEGESDHDQAMLGQISQGSERVGACNHVCKPGNASQT